MVVQHNLTAMNANRYLGINNSKLSKSLEKLSSGYAINRAGDNAAGLAVSEKMRSQIAGMTQGVKNAQDGISMVQTFEGALTETDSILQRMKTLADQMANGTYDDPVDRTAAQQEFLQLNDELDQIADTDFNGVVVLNGGIMADGTVAQDGKFDYSKGYTEEVIANNAVDISKAQEDTMVDQTNYNKATADAVWDALGVDVSKNEELNVTFMYDGSSWKAQTVTDKDGNVVDGARASGLEARTVERDDATGLGGFEVIAGKNPSTGEDIVATNAIFDELKSGKDGKPVNMGDTVTIKFTNTAEKTYAPKNIGFDEDFDATNNDAFTIDSTGTKYTITENNLVGKVGVKLNESVTDKAMNDTMKTALTNLDGAKFTATYAAGELTGIVDDNGKIEAAKDAEGNWELTDKDSGLKLATLTIPNIEDTTPATPEKAAVVAEGTDGTTNGITFTAPTSLADIEACLSADEKTADGAAVTLTFTATGRGNAAKWAVTGGGGTLPTTLANADLAKYGVTLDGAAEDGDTFEVVYTPKKAAVPEKTGIVTDAAGTVKFGINVDAYNVANLDNIAVHAKATPDVATMKHQVAQDKVSQSNAFKNSESQMTYKDNIILQTGARTKDAVNFTFKYSSDAIGDLEADLNCTAKGLGTDRLSIATQEAANYAIDKIDQAINKVSLVRGTFGAIQNRLEHKIDNMNVSIENLTSAESAIRDTNMPTEMMNFTKQQILAQASQSMLAQANQLPQGVLSLLQ